MPKEEQDRSLLPGEEICGGSGLPQPNQHSSLPTTRDGADGEPRKVTSAE